MKNNEPNNIPNDTLKWLKNSRFYGSLDKIFDVSLIDGINLVRYRLEKDKKGKRQNALKIGGF